MRRDRGGSFQYTRSGRRRGSIGAVARPQRRNELKLNEPLLIEDHLDTRVRVADHTSRPEGRLGRCRGRHLGPHQMLLASDCRLRVNAPTQVIASVIGNLARDWFGYANASCTADHGLGPSIGRRFAGSTALKLSRVVQIPGVSRGNRLDFHSFFTSHIPWLPVCPNHLGLAKFFQRRTLWQLFPPSVWSSRALSRIP